MHDWLMAEKHRQPILNFLAQLRTKLVKLHMAVVLAKERFGSIDYLYLIHINCFAYTFIDQFEQTPSFFFQNTSLNLLN